MKLFCRQLWEIGGAEETRFPFLRRLLPPNFFHPATFLFISGLRTPLSVKYIVGLTISRGFNGAIKPSISSPQISFAVEFGASEGELMVSLWPNASCPLDLEVLPFHPPHKMAKNLKMSQIPKISNEPKLLCCGSVGCQLSLCPDGSCPGSTLVPSKDSSKTR